MINIQKRSFWICKQCRQRNHYEDKTSCVSLVDVGDFDPDGCLHPQIASDCGGKQPEWKRVNPTVIIE